MIADLVVQVKKRADLAEGEAAEIAALTTQAFRRDYAPFLKRFADSTHVLARHQGQLVSHALWVTRWLQQADGPLMRTAYIEGVATELSLRYQGLASAVMRRLAAEISDYELAALSTSSTGFYARLGWQNWEGPLLVRTSEGPKIVPGETAMVLFLPKSPPLDLGGPLSVEWREGEIW